jgi:hypothetical protein
VTTTRPRKEKKEKTDTFGAKGFELESAMIDGDDEIRVVRGEWLGQREFFVACTNMEDNRCQDTEHPLPHNVPQYSRVLPSTTTSQWLAYYSGFLPSSYSFI